MPNAGPKPRVVIVEDESIIVDAIRAAFSEEFIVHTANSGPEGLQKILEFEPELVILDVMLPHLSGMEVCRQVRERFPDERIRILAITGYPSQEIVRQMQEAGASDIMVKPFGVVELRQKVRALLPRA
ncbi:MAG: response regulator [Nitrospirota bacterium]